MSKNGEDAPLIAKEVYDIVMNVRPVNLHKQNMVHFGLMCVFFIKHLAVFFRQQRDWTVRSSMTETLSMITLASRCVFLIHVYEPKSAQPLICWQLCVHIDFMYK